MSEINEQDQAEEEEEHGAYESDVLAPDLEEGFRDEECQDDESQPDKDLGTPVSVL